MPEGVVQRKKVQATSLVLSSFFLGAPSLFSSFSSLCPEPRHLYICTIGDIRSGRQFFLEKLSRFRVDKKNYETRRGCG